MSKTNCVNIETNEENCPCGALDCERHGVCCECISTHSSNDSFPSCLRVRMKDSQAFREYVTNLLNRAGTSG